MVKARLDRVKLTEPCKFHVSASLLKTSMTGIQTWKFAKVIKQHTCRVSDSGRSRNVMTRALVQESEAVKHFVPSANANSGATKQVQDMALASGIHLKKSQAFTIVKEKNHHTIEYNLASYWYLRPIINALSAEDPNGTYVLELVCNLIFKRFYVCPSFSKDNFNGTLRIRFCDGTHVTSPYFAGIFLVCVGVDANKQVKLLCFARVGTENKDNWLWFERLCQEDFPHTTFMQSDYSKGIESDDFLELLHASNILYGRCFRHLLKNCNTNASLAGEPTLRESKFLITECIIFYI